MPTANSAQSRKKSKVKINITISLIYKLLILSINKLIITPKENKISPIMRKSRQDQLTSLEKCIEIKRTRSKVNNEKDKVNLLNLNKLKILNLYHLKNESYINPLITVYQYKI